MSILPPYSGKVQVTSKDVTVLSVSASPSLQVFSLADEPAQELRLLDIVEL